MVLDYAPSATMILKPLGTIVINIVNLKTFCDFRCTNEVIDLWGMNGELWLYNTV